MPGASFATARAPGALRAAFAISIAALVSGMLAGALRSLYLEGRLPKLGLNVTRHFRALEASGNRAELAREWQVLAAIDPSQRGIAHAKLATLFAEEGRVDEALAALDVALERSPADPALHENRAILLEAQGRAQEARAASARAEQLRRLARAARARR